MSETQTDLAAAIRAKVELARRIWSGDHTMLRMCDLADAILARHTIRIDVDPSDWCTVCSSSDYWETWPCSDVHALATAWGVEP